MAVKTPIVVAIIVYFLIKTNQTCDNLVTISVIENIPYPSAPLLDVAKSLMSSQSISNTGKNGIYLTDQKKSQPFSLSHGKLIVTNPLDRERICGDTQMDQNIIQKCCISICCLYIGITTPTGKIFYIRVNIEDENDNEPVFPQSFLKLSIHENVEKGHIITLPKAEDLDSLNFGIDRYEIISDKSCIGCFQVKTDSKDRRPILVTNSKIDREVNSVFSLLLLAIDRGRPSKTGSLSIVIDVEDINDNHPQFVDSTIVLSVEENGRSGREIHRIRVTDADIGVNSHLLYMIEDYNSLAQRHFKLVPVSSGISLQLQSVLDYESKNKFQFYIVAKDQGTPSLSSTATVNIAVINVNDEPPEILFYNRGSVIDPNSIQLTQPEHGPKHQTIILIHVADKDSKLSDINCEVSYPKDTFYLRETENTNIIEKKKIFELQNLVEFDREKKSAYRIGITCTDSTTLTKLTNSVEIQLQISDVNDNPPVFSSALYFGKITETNLLDQDVQIIDGPIKVMDTDIGLNKEIKLYLSDTKNLSDSKYFSVSTEHRVIKNKEPIDYEKCKRFEFLLIAVDSGNQPLTATARITISVLDANDNLPEILKRHYMFSVLEEQPIGTKVGKIEAVDIDSDPRNRDVIFEILNLDGTQKRQRQNDLFIIENNTGYIKTRVILDHEKDQNIGFMVRVRNTNEFFGPQDRLDHHSSSAAISVKIIDINDNSPKLILKESTNSEPSGACLSSQKPIVIVTDFQSQSNLCSVFPYTFKDLDEGINAEIKITLKENQQFKLDLGNQIICLKSHTISPGYYTANVIGEDRLGGNGTRRVECLINIQVKSSSSNKPQIQSKKPRQEIQDKMVDTKTIIIFIVLIAVIIIFCFLLMVVVFKSKLCLPAQLSPSYRGRGKPGDKSVNPNTAKAYSSINPVGNCENKRLCDDYVSTALNNYRTVTPNYSQNLLFTRTNSPNTDIRILKYPMTADNRFVNLTTSCDELFVDHENPMTSDLPNSANLDLKYEQLNGPVGPVNQLNNTMVWDKGVSHQYNYLLEPRDSGSLPVKGKNFNTKSEATSASSNSNQKSINDVYLQTSFV